MVDQGAAAALDRFKAEGRQVVTESRMVRSAGDVYSAEAQRLEREFQARRDAAEAAFTQQWREIYAAEYEQRINQAKAAAVHAEHARIESVRVEDAQRRAAEQAAQIKQRVAAARADADRLGLSLEEYLAASR